MARLFLLIGIVLFVVVFFSLSAQAQDGTSAMPHFALSGFVGGALNNPNWNWFEWQKDDSPYGFHVSPTGNVGVVYGPLSFIQQTNIYLSLEGGYYKLQTADAELLSGTAHAEMEQIPILAWAELSTESRVSPFVGVGVGAGHVRFQELYTHYEDENIAIAYWGFAWGYRLGVDWKISSNVRLAFSAGQTMVEGTHMVSSEGGSRYGIRTRNATGQAGIRLEHSL